MLTGSWHIGEKFKYMFDKIKTNLAEQLSGSLPGATAQYRMANHFRQLRVREHTPAPPNARVAGVLAMFYPKNGETFLTLMLRTQRGAHSGQVSFPGGGVEEQDADIVATALREAQEEVGIQPEDVTVLGKLTSLYIPVSNSLVKPIVGYSDRMPDYEIDPEEVQSVIEAPLSKLLDADYIKTTNIKIKKGVTLSDIPYYDVNGHIVWGATAMMLSELLEVVEGL